LSLSFNNPRAVETYRDKTTLFPIEEKLFHDHLHGDILDLGCGTGRTTRHIRDMGHNVVGVDISPLQIEAAKQDHPDIRFYVKNAARLTLPDNLFDCVVFSFNGLDYLYPYTLRVKAVEEVFRVLRPGGCFIFSSHDEPSIKKLSLRKRLRLQRVGGHYYREKTRTGSHITYYGWANLNRRMCAVAGFRKRFDVHPLNGHAWRYYVAWA
jgi:SAM-dependent methyltransferase